MPVPIATQTCPVEQPMPHAPQLAASSTRVSQPVETMPSQSPHPGWQFAIQRPLVHVTDTALSTAVGHGAAVHEPQRATSVVVSVSQPSPAVQSSKGAVQATISHVPVAQLTVAFGNEQATLHPPQLSSSRIRDSQPSSGIPLQS